MKTKEKDYTFEIYKLLGYRIVEDEEQRKLINDFINNLRQETAKEVITIIKRLKHYDPLLVKELIKEIKQKFIKGETDGKI